MKASNEATSMDINEANTNLANMNLANTNLESQKMNTKQKPSELPDKFWNAETGEVRLNALISSYRAMEKRFSERKPNMVPSSSDEYAIEVKDNLFPIDSELNARLLEKGFTQAQAQEVYDLAVEQLLPLMASLAASYKADREVEKLMAHFGGMDGWNETARQLKAYAEKRIPRDALHGLVSSYDGIIALHKMMLQDMSDGITVNGNAVGIGQMQDVNAMMQSPKYWRDKDPAYIAKVTAAFQRAYD